MVLTSSRILSCEVWLMLIRNTSAPASNSRRIMVLSEEAGPSVARILMRRKRLMACLQAPLGVAEQPQPEALRPADWAARGPCLARGFDRTGFFEVDTGEQRAW